MADIQFSIPPQGINADQIEPGKAPEARQYRAYWGGSFMKPGTSNLNGSFFSDDNGYDTEDVAAIAALTVGEEWISSDFGSDHVVTRLL